MIGTLGGGVLVLACLLICVLRCMCCQKRKSKKEAKLDVFDREERAGLLHEGKTSSSSLNSSTSSLNFSKSLSTSSSGLFYDSGRFESRTPQTDRRREEIRAKWGLKSTTAVN